jgi:hypothetical protein
VSEISVPLSLLTRKNFVISTGNKSECQLYCHIKAKQPSAVQLTKFVVACSWVKESRLDQLPFARQKLAYFYLSAAGTMFTLELSEARILWAKNGVLTTVVDDFFDVGGSKEELENLVTLVEMYDPHPPLSP